MNNDGLTPEQIDAVRVRNALISKWGADTISMFSESIKTQRPSDILCITTLSVCSTYCNAIMTLLQNGWRMPAEALLRILFEVSTKVLWCLAERKTDHSESAVEERIYRWAKASLEQNIKLRRDFLNILTGEERNKLEESITEYEEKRDQLGCNPMPKQFVGILKELGDSWHREYYPQLYRQFNDAVHLDFASLCNKAKDDGRTVSVTYDSNEPIGELAQCCVVDMHILFFAIRSHYGWDTKEMDKEFKGVNQSHNS